MFTSATTITTGLVLAAASTNALSLDVNSASSIKSAAKTIASNVANIYSQSLNSSGIPGTLGQPYYWWESGLMFDSLINYWALTGDESYNDLVTQGMLWQSISHEPNADFMPANQSASEGNDDQSFWGLAAMTAEEKGLPAPSKSSGVQSWVELAENVFNSQAERWDSSHCNGGLRWQIYAFNAGYNYKNAVSNGNFLQLAGRLAHYTGNKTYADWAQRMAEWSTSVGIIEDYQINDGVSITKNCSEANNEQFTLNYGSYLGGYAYMANYSWNNAVPKFVSKINETFVKNGIITEVICAPTGTCNADSEFYRAVLARALANTAAMVPSVSNSILPVLRSSAEGAAGQCSGGSSGTACGSSWNTTKYDGTTGLGQELSALEIILANLNGAKPDTESSATTTTPSTNSSSTTGTGSGATTSMTSASTSTSQGASTTTTTGASSATTSPSAADGLKVSSLGGMAVLGLAMVALA